VNSPDQLENRSVTQTIGCK